MNEDKDIEISADDEGVEEQAEGKVARLRSELAQCRKEKQEYMDGWQRAKADYVNALKRFETDAKVSELRGRVGAIQMLLPAFDALERAREHGEVPAGFAGIAKQLESAFATLGLEAVGEVGEVFDPALHEALGTDAAQSVEEDNTVSAVLEKGWRLGDTLVRPTKVRVTHFEK
ncbi:MAG: nucleotide exchange factor GrpE [bacterium]|nr:nucleotide exchange factor GrpE [bacterium]